MKEIYIAATNRGGVDDQVSPVFGRARTFTVVEVEDGKILGASVVDNPFQGAPGGAGIRAAQFVAEKHPRAVFAGNFGPNVAEALAQAGIAMVPVTGLTVREAVEKYVRGELTPMAGPTLGAGYGLGMGRGRGMGYGWGMGYGPGGYGPPPPPPAPGEATEPEELRERIKRLERELAEIRRKLKELKGGE